MASGFVDLFRWAWRWLSSAASAAVPRRIGLPARLDVGRALPARLSTSKALPASDTMSAYSEIQMFRGEDVTLTFTCDPPVDLTGATVTWGMRLRTDSSPTVSKTATITDAAAGIFTVTLAYADTSDLTCDQYVWDARRQPAGSKATLANGTLELYPEVIS